GLDCRVGQTSDFDDNLVGLVAPFVAGRQVDSAQQLAGCIVARIRSAARIRRLARRLLETTAFGAGVACSRRRSATVRISLAGRSVAWSRQVGRARPDVVEGRRTRTETTEIRRNRCGTGAGGGQQYAEHADETCSAKMSHFRAHAEPRSASVPRPYQGGHSTTFIRPAPRRR